MSTYKIVLTVKTDGTPQVLDAEIQEETTLLDDIRKELDRLAVEEETEDIDRDYREALQELEEFLEKIQASKNE